MTRKDYVLLSKALADAYEEASADWPTMEGVALATSEIADALKAANPRFERKRFLDDALGTAT